MYINISNNRITGNYMKCTSCKILGHFFTTSKYFSYTMASVNNFFFLTDFSKLCTILYNKEIYASDVTFKTRDQTFDGLFTKEDKLVVVYRSLSFLSILTETVYHGS